MERLKEEDITKYLISLLKVKGFEIFSYDFPQSGTGYCIRPNATTVMHKNINYWIPDIIAIKNDTLFLFENKDHYSLSDIRKLQNILENKTHSEGLDKLMQKTSTSVFHVILGYPFTDFKQDRILASHIGSELGCDINNNLVLVKEETNILTKLLKE